MQKIIPCLWFDDNAEEAINFYISAFSNLSTSNASQIISINRYPDDVQAEFMKGMEGKVLTAMFELAGYRFMALDGGPQFKFTPATSFFIHCNTEDELDELWAILSEDASILMPLGTYDFSQRFGWLEDKFGISWQIILAEQAITQVIIPSLTFVGDQAGNAEEAIKFYADLFKDASVGDITRYGAEQAPEEEGTIMYAEFTLANQLFEGCA